MPIPPSSDQNRAGKSRKTGFDFGKIVFFVLVYLSAGCHHFLFATEVARPVRAQLLDIKGFFLLPGPAYTGVVETHYC